MGRKSNQRKPNRPSRQKTSNLEDLLLTQHSLDSFLENRYSPDSLRSLRKELKDAITKIYSKFIHRFCQIKDLRNTLQDPYTQIPTEDLIIEKNYCNELTQKVKQLVHLDSLTDIYYTFCKSVIHFTSQINTELQSLSESDPQLQLIYLVEAYQVVQNSARELSKVTSGIFENQPNYITCENVTKLAFLDRVLKGYKDLIGRTEDSEALGEMKAVQKDLIELAENINGLDRESKSQGKNLIPPSNAEKTLDEIVSFINGNAREDKKVTRRRRVSKASTAETSGSPFRQRSLEALWTSLDKDEKVDSVDKEVREFQAKLESAKPLFHRLKPSLSEEWLKKIRSQLLGSIEL